MMRSGLDLSSIEWRKSLDPTLEGAAQKLLVELVILPENSPRRLTLSIEEVVLREELIRTVKPILIGQAEVLIPAIVMVTIFFVIVAWISVSVWAGIGVLAASAAAIIGCVLLDGQKAVAKGNATALNVALANTLPRVATSEYERLYSAVVRELLPSGVSLDPFSDAMRREQMALLNVLLDSGRRLDTVRSDIAAALATATPQSLRTEVDSLRQRLERTADPGTRSALAQSLALCEERLHRAEALDGMTERIEAEQELVYQAFRAAQSSIAALRVSPTVAGLDGAAGTASVAEVAETIGRQTRAVEAAVQELEIRR